MQNKNLINVMWAVLCE